MVLASFRRGMYAESMSQMEPGYLPDDDGRAMHWLDCAAKIGVWRQEIERYEAACVAAARAEGSSWARIARMIGQTEQQLRRRYGK